MYVVIDILLAILKLGLPLAGLSWFLFSQIYNNGDMDREADRKAINSHLKSLKASYKNKKKVKEKENEKDKDKGKANINMVQDKWMRFGGGFYGLAALWTFVIVEISDIFNFIVHNPGWAALFGDGLINLLIEVLVNQLQNFIAAFIWFSYWDADSIPLLVLVAYAGYWLGVELARRQYVTAVMPWIEKIRLWLKLDEL